MDSNYFFHIYTYIFDFYGTVKEIANKVRKMCCGLSALGMIIHQVRNKKIFNQLVIGE